MDTEELMESTRNYLNNYLEEYVYNQKESDEGYFKDGVEVLPHELRYKFGARLIDLHLDWFKELHDPLPEASVNGFIDALAEIEDLVLVHIGHEYSSDFGLWVAKKNPDSTLLNYDCFAGEDHGRLNGFPAYLFNEMRTDELVKMHNPVQFNKLDIEKSINNLFRENGFQNVEFRRKVVNKAELEKVVSEAKGRPVVFYSERTPTDPNEMTYPIAKTVAAHDNADLILMPFLNTELNQYQDDELMRKISKHQDYFQKTHKSGQILSSAGQTGRTRVFCAMHLYYALKIAEIADAEIYRQKEFPSKPVFSVSTIEPKRA